MGYAKLDDEKHININDKILYQSITSLFSTLSVIF